MFKRLKIIALTCTCFLLTGYQATAQFSLIKRYHGDTLQHALEKAASDSIKVRLNYLLVNYWGLIDEKKAVPYLKQAEKLNKAYPFLIAAYPFYEGYTCWSSDKERSEALFLKAERALSRYDTPEAYFLRAKSLRNYGLHQQERHNQEALVDYVLRAIPLAKQSGDSSFTGLLYQDAANVFMNTSRFQKAAAYYEQAILFSNNGIPDYETLAYIYARAARTYIFAGQYPKAKEKLDEVERLFARLRKPIDEIEFYMAKGMYYNRLKNYQNSARSLDKGIELAKKKNEPHLLLEVYYQHYINFRDQKDYQQALNVLQLVKEELAGYSSFGISLHNKLRLYFDLSETYASLGDMPRAYKWLKDYTVLNDSVSDARLKEKIGEMEVKFQTAEKQKRINELEVARQKALLDKQAQRSTNQLLSLISFTLLLTTVFLIYYYRNVKKQTRHQLKEAEQGQELKITHALLQGEERERKRVARDLHDGLGGMLAGIRMKLSGEVKEELRNRAGIERVIGQLDNSIAELRRIARNMMPEMLVRFGLQAALKDLCESLSSKQTVVECEFYQIDAGIEPAKQIVIYRIIQELLSNAIRHAGATHIYLQCSQNENIFLITVEDDGKGFDPALLKDKKGIGLRNIENRVNYLNGKMELSTQANEGATINIEVHV